LVDAAEAGDDLGPALDALFASVSDPEAPYRLIARGEREWLAEWAARDEGSLRRALWVFAHPTRDLESAFTSFAAAARQAQAAGTMKEQPGARITFGSLLNFGNAPELSPVVRLPSYGVLERMLGFPDRPVRSVTDRYRHHLAFAHEVQERLGNAGVEARDMIDVQAVIFSTAVALSRRAMWLGETPPSVSLPRPQPRPNNNGAYLAACSCLGYDTAYLLEWIEFHRLVGIERFFLYNNGDREAQRDLLQPYVEEGVVVLYDWALFPPQIPAARHCLAAHREDARWIAFFDTDEFLFSPTGMPLPVLLTSYERWPGVGVNGANFGTSGHREKPVGLVIESYLKRLADSHVKLIIDPRRAADCVTPHYFTYKDGYAVDENGYPIVGAQTSYISFSRFRLNHYFTKSEAEFRTKLTHNRPDFGEERDPERLARQLEALTELGETDRDILQFVPALRALLERRRQELPLE
jgi:hypothetical protein